MNETTADTQFEVLRATESYAQELHEFLDSLPQKLKWEKFDELKERCQALRVANLGSWGDDSLQASWARTQQRLSELYDQLSAHTPSTAILDKHEELARTYEQWIASFRSVASRVGGSTKPRRLSSLKPLIKARTIFHSGMGLMCACLYQFLLSRKGAIIALLSVYSVVLFLEITRRFSKSFNHTLLTSPVFRPIARPHEYHQVNSATYYLTALCLITPVFPQPAVIAAVLILGLGDPAAAWVGKKYGTIKLYGRKSVVGSATFLAVGVLVSAAFMLGLHPEIPTGRAILACLAASACGMVAELYSGRLDDNFTIPIAAVVGAWAVL